MTFILLYIYVGNKAGLADTYAMRVYARELDATCRHGITTRQVVRGTRGPWGGEYVGCCCVVSVGMRSDPNQREGRERYEATRRV